MEASLSSLANTHQTIHSLCQPQDRKEIFSILPCSDSVDIHFNFDVAKTNVFLEDLWVVSLSEVFFFFFFFHLDHSSRTGLSLFYCSSHAVTSGFVLLYCTTDIEALGRSFPLHFPLAQERRSM